MSVTLSAFGGVGAQFFDNNGDPLTGGKIFTYAAGTTTPLATYTTGAGNVARTNPIILDAAGRVPGGGEIWVTTGVGYKFVLTTSTDVLIATYDNVPSSAPPVVAADADQVQYEQGYTVNAGSFVVGKTYQILTVGNTNFVAIGAASNTVGVYFVATGVGSGTGTARLSQTVAAKLQQTVSVKDFGAVGDGSTDDTAAINAAATYCRSSGAGLLLPATSTNYKISDTIDFTGIAYISGQNALLMTTGFTGKPAVIIGGPGASILNYPWIYLQVRNILDKSNVAGTNGIRILGMRYSRLWLYVRGFDTGLYFDGVTQDTNWVSCEFNILSLYNNGTQVHFDLAGTSYFVSNQFRGGSYYIGTNQKVAGRGTFKVTLAGSSQVGQVVVDSAEIGIDRGSLNTDHATLLYGTFNTTFNTSSISFTNIRIELYGAFAYDVYLIYFPTTTSGRIAINAEFLSISSFEQQLIDIGTFTEHQVFIEQTTQFAINNASQITQTNYRPTYAFQANNNIFVPDRTLFNNDYSVPVSSINFGVGTRLNRAIEDGRFYASSTAISYGVRLNKTVGQPLFLVLNQRVQTVVICYDASGTVLSGTSPWYAVMKTGRSQARTGATVYEGNTNWVYIHPDVASFYIGACAWFGPNYLPDFQFQNTWGPPPTRDYRDDTAVNLVTSSGVIQGYYPVGMAFDATASNGFRNTFALDTTLSASSSSGDSTVTVTTVTGVLSGDTIGVELDTVISGTERQYFWTTVNGAPVGNVVTLTATLPANATSGRRVVFGRWVAR